MLVGEKHMASIALPVRRHGLSLKLGLALTLVAAGDMIFYQHGAFGVSIGLFALSWLAVTIAANPALSRRPAAWIAIGIAAIAGSALVFDPGMIAWILFWVALSMAALLPATGAFDDGWRWFQRLLVHGVCSIAGSVIDTLKFRRARRGKPSSTAIGTMLPTLALPIAGSVVILLLFASANPVMSEVLSAIRLPAISGETTLRAIVWAML